MNDYTISYCPHCARGHLGSTLSTHGADNTSKALKMIADGVEPEEVYQSFCGYCGSHIEGDWCSCGHTRRQHYYNE